MKRFILILMALHLLSACGSGGSSGGGAGSSSETKVNGKTPEDYFGQFVAYTEGECNSEKLYIHSAGSEAININQDEEGRDIKAQVTLFMKKDHSFRAIYKEMLIYKYIDNGYQYKDIFSKEMTGTWSTDSEGRFHLEGFGSGQAIEYNKRQAIFFQFDRDIHTQGLAGKNAYIYRSFHSASTEENQAVCSGGL